MNKLATAAATLTLILLVIGLALTIHSITATYPKVEKTVYTYVKTFPGLTKTYTKTDYVVVEENWRPYYPTVTAIGVLFTATGLYFLLSLILAYVKYR